MTEHFEFKSGKLNIIQVCFPEMPDWIHQALWMNMDENQQHKRGHKVIKIWVISGSFGRNSPLCALFLSEGKQACGVRSPSVSKPGIFILLFLLREWLRLNQSTVSSVALFWLLFFFFFNV